jgi:hypothetical protein
VGPTVFVSGAVEGPSDEAVFRRISLHCGADVHRVQVQMGKTGLRHALPGYNRAAMRDPWVVLVDLDDDYPCPGALLGDWLPSPARYMRLRVVVPQIEAWLLADTERMAQFLGVRQAIVPARPETLPNAKAALIALAAKSRKSAVRDDMVPRPGAGRMVGPAYTSRIVQFSGSPDWWRPEVAAARAPSLSRCLERTRQLIKMFSRK